MKNTKDLWDKIIVLDIGLRSKQDLLYDNTLHIKKLVYIKRIQNLKILGIMG